jgi:hypothetical protein
MTKEPHEQYHSARASQRDAGGRTRAKLECLPGADIRSILSAKQKDRVAAVYPKYNEYFDQAFA